MDILIKGMEIPTSCAKCRISFDIGNEYLCQLCTDPNQCVVGGEFWRECGDEGAERRPDWCPLVEVPPHGRLIDATKLIALCEEMQGIEWNNKAAPYSWAYAYESFENDIDNAPTIIEAEADDG